ncbi:acetyltransferase [Sporomusa sp.]|uniref:acetyltransferase n=1 Tax=Sporomusa sp. TaxID=2078658 RepID=UPI002CD56E03|nr:acetyltransferase [Sporomusa sp.]HWR45830.1 acetyltransferase [Sporomusa sp.]
MTCLLILGAGGHGVVLAETAEETGLWDKIAFLDDKYPSISTVAGWSVIGKVEMAIDLVDQYFDAAIGIGDNLTRAKLLYQVKQFGYRLPVIVHPSAYISKSAELGEGTVVFAQAAVNARAKIGCGSIINTGATVDHDCELAQGVHISPGAHVAGEVKVGEFSWMGVGASVIPRIEIGKNVLVGAGSVIIRNISDGVVVVGNPGRTLKQNI